ncbi:MAG: hypothetical protein KIS96_11515 [Bauldia sp.]|nr:hypothetical protein [Bauldia sp.]
MGARRHDDRIRYIIEVLWLIGHTASEIAALINYRFPRSPLTRKAVQGIIERGSFAKRSEMTDGQRQRRLDELMKDRLDRGVLAADDFRVMKLGGQQVKLREPVGA